MVLRKGAECAGRTREAGGTQWPREWNGLVDTAGRGGIMPFWGVLAALSGSIYFFTVEVCTGTEELGLSDFASGETDTLSEVPYYCT
jgi:hypothetical protein